MAAYLLAANPIKQGLHEIETIEDLEEYTGRIRRWTNWRCCSGKVIEDDKCFVVLLGQKERNGIIASGCFTSGPYSYKGFEERATKAKYAGVSFFVVAGRDRLPIPISVLKESMPDQCWTPQSSGIRIKDEYVETLEYLWGNSGGMEAQATGIGKPIF